MRNAAALPGQVTELGPDFGMPEFYRVVTSTTGIPPWCIHYSRLIRFDGVPLPYQQRLTENDWACRSPSDAVTVFWL